MSRSSPFGVVAGGTGSCGQLGIVGALLGPEGSDDFFVWCLLRVNPFFEPPAEICEGLGLVGVDCWVGFARTLRTAQWTRASLWLSYEEHTVDA